MEFTGFTPGAAAAGSQAPEAQAQEQAVVVSPRAEDPAAGGLLPIAPVAGAKTTMDEMTIVPKTYGELVEHVTVDSVLNGLLVDFGVDASTELADVACIAEAGWHDALAKATVDEVIVGPLQRARAVRAIRSFYVKLGFAPPGLGAPVSAAPPPAVVPPAPPAASTLAVALGPGASSLPAAPSIWAPAVPAVLDEMQQVSLRDYIDQGLKGSCQRLDRDTLLATRAHYELKTDHEPRDNCKPTVEQLSCLSALLRAGRTPYTDFGVWNVFGPRLARFTDFDAQVVVQGTVVSKRIQAPSTLEGWTACWELFEAAMIGLDAASVGALRVYAAGLKELATLFPDKWPLLVTTDVIVRSERWTDLKEKCDQTHPAGYDPSRPWAFIIPTSAWGSGDARVQQWWQRMVVLPAATRSSVGSATSLVNALEGGGAVPAAAAAFPGNHDSSRGRRRSRTPPRGNSSEKPRGDVCRDFNLEAGRCSGRGACPSGRSHECAVCGGIHRGVHHHTRNAVLEALGMSKDKGKGKKGGGKKGGKGGGKKADHKKKE